MSLPPLTNCEETKMSATSKNILIEITSTHTLEFCKQLMEQLFTEMFNNGIVSQDIAELETATATALTSEVADLNLNKDEQDPSSSSSQETTTRQLRHKLILQQVKIIDMKGNLKCVYPSRVDLTFNDSIKYQVIRLYND